MAPDFSKTSNLEGPTEKSLMEAVNLDSLNVSQPRNVDAESAKPRTQQQVIPIARKEEETETSIERKAFRKTETVTSDMFLPFMRNPLINIVEPSLSSFVPSSLMLYYVIHELDMLMAQNYYFNRSTTLWHPYITRLYYGILFIIQTLRSMNKVNALSIQQRLFLDQFLDSFPPETLSIAGPLIPFFRALACSRPNDLNLGQVYPYLPQKLGPRSPGNRILKDKAAFLWPNIPLLIGFINRITSTEAKNSANRNGASNDVAEYPSPWNPLQVLSFTGQTTRSPMQPIINGVQWSSDPTTWDDQTAWSLVSQGVSYPIETSDDQNKKFTRFGSNLKIPTIEETDNLNTVQSFCQLHDLTWFAKLLPVMTLYAKYFKAQGTLADCSPEGGSSTRITIKYEAPKQKKDKPLLPKPTTPGDDYSRFAPVFRSRTTEYGINQFHSMEAHLTQLNVEIFEEHPYFGKVGTLENDDREGPFWSITPVSHESMRDTGYLQIADILSDHFALDKAMN